MTFIRVVSGCKTGTRLCYRKNRKWLKCKGDREPLEDDIRLREVAFCHEGAEADTGDRLNDCEVRSQTKQEGLRPLALQRRGDTSREAYGDLLWVYGGRMLWV